MICVTLEVPAAQWDGFLFKFLGWVGVAAASSVPGRRGFNYGVLNCGLTDGNYRDMRGCLLREKRRKRETSRRLLETRGTCFLRMPFRHFNYTSATVGN